MSTYQIDLDLLENCRQVYVESALQLESDISGLSGSMVRLTDQDYSGEDARYLRNSMSSFINKKAKSTKEVLSNMAIKTRRAHTQGQLCKKKCYDFVYALGGSSAVKSHHAFGGMMRCDQEQIQGLINTSRKARVNADGITVTAERVLNALNNSVKSIPTDYESYAKELISACEKVEKSLEEHSKDLIEYAMRVEEMDTSLQTSFAECIIDGYKQTADGVDNRFAYMDIEYSLEELNRLEAKSESERTPEEQAKLEVLLMKKAENIEKCGTIRDVPLNEYTKTNINMDNAIYVYNQLIAAGFTKQAAAAVMGNLDIENSFSTAWSGDQGSVGIAQWREDRKVALEKFAKEIGGDPTDIKVQVRYLIEIDMPDKLKGSAYEEFKNMTDYIDAADCFCHYVERPARHENYDAWVNGKYGPNYAEHGGTCMIKWERFEWSEQLQLYELDLKGRRTAAKHWYETMQ